MIVNRMLIGPKPVLNATPGREPSGKMRFGVNTEPLEPLSPGVLDIPTMSKHLSVFAQSRNEGLRAAMIYVLTAVESASPASVKHELLEVARLTWARPQNQLPLVDRQVINVVISRLQGIFSGDDLSAQETITARAQEILADRVAREGNLWVKQVMVETGAMAPPEETGERRYQL
jgi:hypothetical protein